MAWQREPFRCQGPLSALGVGSPRQDVRATGQGRGIAAWPVGQVPGGSGLRVLQPPGRPGLGALWLEGLGRTHRSWRAWDSHHQLLGENEITCDDALWRPAQTRAGRVSGTSSPICVVCVHDRFLALLEVVLLLWFAHLPPLLASACLYSHSLWISKATSSTEPGFTVTYHPRLFPLSPPWPWRAGRRLVTWLLLALLWQRHPLFSLNRHLLSTCRVQSGSRTLPSTSGGKETRTQGSEWQGWLEAGQAARCRPVQELLLGEGVRERDRSPLWAQRSGLRTTPKLVPGSQKRQAWCGRGEWVQEPCGQFKSGSKAQT